MWYWVALILAELHFGILRGALTMVKHAVERYTAPKIIVLAPRTNFDGVAPEAEPLQPNSGGPGVIQCYDKGTNVKLGTVQAWSPDDVKAAVERARVAQQQWGKTSFSTRRALMFSLLDWILANQAVLCRVATIECGKTVMDSTLGELLTTLEKLRWTAAYGEEVLQEDVRDVGLMTIHKRASVQYLPLGVIGAIVSWNYPFHNIFGPMISALFAGNAFVGKTSEYTSYYTPFYQAIVREGLKALGQNPDLVTFVTGFADAGEAIVDNCDKVTFIGSPFVGKLVMRRASEKLTPVVLELGGKDPAILLDDADVEQVIPILMRGTYQNCGQNCVGVERVVMHRSLYDKIVPRLVELVKPLSQGPASQSTGDLGAMTMGASAVNKIQKLVDAAVAAGAKVLVGGKATSPYFYPPTVIVNVDEKNPIALEEVFGPVLVVMTFEDDADALRVVNACPYSLGSNVFSSNKARAEAIAKQVRAGMCNINDFAINYLAQSLPFGGVSISGFDRFAGVEGLRGNCNVRAQTIDRIPGVKTLIPPVLQYPITDKAYDFMETLTKLIYGRVVEEIQAAVALATFDPKSPPNKKQ